MDIQAKLFFDLIDKDQNGMLSKVNQSFYLAPSKPKPLKDRDETVFGNSSPETDRQLSNCSRSGRPRGRCWKDFRRKGKPDRRSDQFLGKIQVYLSCSMQLNLVFRKRWRLTSSWLVTTEWWQWSLLIWCRNNKNDWICILKFISKIFKSGSNWKRWRKGRALCATIAQLF